MTFSRTAQVSRWIGRALISATALLLTSAATRAENWPQWRGPAGTGVSGEKELPLVWNDRIGLVWKAQMPGAGASTPVVWGDAIFVTSQRDDALLVSKIGKKSGQFEWTKTVGSGTTPRDVKGRGRQKFNDLHNLASPSPVTDGKTVVVHFGNGDLAAYDYGGRQIWSRNLQQDHGAYTIWWGHANSPVLYKDLVISVCMQDSLADLPQHSAKPAASYLVAHELATGRVRWKTPRMTGAKSEEGDSYTTPLLRTKSDGAAELIVMGGNQLDSYDPETGKQIWHLPNLIGGRTVTGPTIAGDRVFVTRGMRGALHAVELGGTGKLNYESIAWNHRTGTPDSCSPVVWDNWLFVVTDDGVARCFDATTGTLKWQNRLRGSYKASPVAADGRVYFLNTSGLCTVVSAAGRFSKLTENQLDDQTLASPAISDGRIFIRGNKHLFAVEK
jgi:outer membrane protein assembly factor BamB